MMARDRRIRSLPQRQKRARRLASGFFSGQLAGPSRTLACCLPCQVSRPLEPFPHPRSVQERRRVEAASQAARLALHPALSPAGEDAGISTAWRGFDRFRWQGQRNRSPGCIMMAGLNLEQSW